MSYKTKKRNKKLKKLNRDYHRDLGYFFSGLIIIYCLSGLAFNHMDDWDPDFILNKEDIKVEKKLSKKHFTETDAEYLSELCGEDSYKLYDFPTNNQVKIYFKNASFHVNLDKGEGVYESIQRRPIFYESNILHRNNVKGWRWVSDIFAVGLIIVTITGLFIASGKYSFKRRGKIYFLAGFLPPLIAIIIYYLS
ncbi:PepSY-associated TM helix domain-containing protein [Weeksellaceae bacterium TAE3-ERU29]|nr:PepSY-associated TM helix domain-containing protein [Weeksellaceae bacterium TAE3-ERU29]